MKSMGSARSVLSNPAGWAFCLGPSASVFPSPITKLEVSHASWFLMNPSCFDVLIVWNILIIFAYIGNIIPTDFHIFQKGLVETTNQYHITILCFIYYYCHHHITIITIIITILPTSNPRL